MDNDYDCFINYQDGIYQIKREEYVDFHRGKNIKMDFNRNINILYMLKKKGYYCFIHQAKDKKLSILNGGSLKRLNYKYIEYYYNNMDKQIELLKSPLDKYMSYQKNISDAITAIGGIGYIHGCIIDIDYYNHIYLNPIDLSITGYWAEDIVYKIAYKDIPSLLQDKCPILFENYKKMLTNNKDEIMIINHLNSQLQKNVSELYLDTDIYNASREIKKMQKLNQNILTVWYDIDMNKKEENILITSNNK